jgi:deoxyribodipyrimidine photolyase-related protein
VRNVVLVLGDQLNHDSAAFRGFDPGHDRVVMIEAPGEATHVWSSTPRIAMFLAAMRHFAAELESRGRPPDYVRLDDMDAPGLPDRLAACIRRLRPAHVIVGEPGEYRVLAAIQDVCRAAGVPLDVRADVHFICSRQAFAEWAGGASSLRMEFFYRGERRRTGILMDGAAPAGGAWNYDRENRAGFGRAGPVDVPNPRAFAPDAITRGVLADVARLFPAHPGKLDDFDWPVTRADALVALDDFIAHRLAGFGRHQDAMWTDMPFGWHARLSAALNLKLLDPREVIAAAEAAYRAGKVPLPAAEGFIRQVLGWREFIRGVYWLDMPGLRDANHFGHRRPLPRWYWTGETRMNCLRHAVGQTLRFGYAHHIQRLMVTGNFALLAEVLPQAVCDWYLAVYVDAVEWAELPNTSGMALYANGGRFTSKPYVASGAYVKRMSNYCQGCRYRPEARTGADACPFTTLYWNFLDRHEAAFAANPRTALMARNLGRLGAGERRDIRAAAARMLEKIDAL